MRPRRKVFLSPILAIKSEKPHTMSAMEGARAVFRQKKARAGRIKGARAGHTSPINLARCAMAKQKVKKLTEAEYEAYLRKLLGK